MYFELQLRFDLPTRKTARDMTLLADTFNELLDGIELEIPVNRCALDSLTCRADANAIGHRGIWGVPQSEFPPGTIEIGRRIVFIVWGGDVVERGRIVELLTPNDAYREIGFKPCSAVNDLWFRWE